MPTNDAINGADFATNFLAHYGVKGMKWGVRKKRTVETTKVKTSHSPGGRVTAKGGAGQKASEDAVRAAVSKQKAKASTTDALSNKELRDLVNRMNLEKQYHDLRPKTKPEKTKKFVKDFILGVGKNQASQAANNAAAQQVGKVLNNKK